MAVERTPNTSAAAIKDMCIDHCCPHVLVTEEFLNSSNVVTVLEQMGGKAMTKGVATAMLGNVCELDCLFDASLQNLW